MPMKNGKSQKYVGKGKKSTTSTKKPKMMGMKGMGMGRKKR